MNVPKLGDLAFLIWQLILPKSSMLSLAIYIILLFKQVN